MRVSLELKNSVIERSKEETAELDKRHNDVRSEIARLEACLRDAQQHERDATRFKEELDHTKKEVAQKDADLRATLSAHIETNRQVADERRSLQNRVQLLEEERLSLTSQLATKNEQILSLGREHAQLQQMMASLEAKFAAKEQELMAAKEAMILLGVEKEAHSKCQFFREEERRERIATSAQLQQAHFDHHKRIYEMEIKTARENELQNSNMSSITEQFRLAHEESRKQSDINTGLENEIVQLKEALKDASANHEAIEKLGRANGELQILRRRMSDASGMMVCRKD